MHLSYLRKEGSWPSPRLGGDCLPWIQQEGDPAFFTSRAKRVIDADYHRPVGVVFFNHLEADFAMKSGGYVMQMTIQVIANCDTGGRRGGGPRRHRPA
uniref:Uncharacterized protein n=1 Tax=Aegilops tauschii subsp. strangulata TaxID=200361 RepID=A0A453AKK8_AEGTS